MLCVQVNVAQSLEPTLPAPQQKDLPIIVVEDVRATSDLLKNKGFDSKAVTQAIKRAAARMLPRADSSKEGITSNEMLRRYTLTGSLRDFRNGTVWMGELTWPGGTTVRYLGPIIAQQGPAQRDALAIEITSAIKQILNADFSAAEYIRVQSACFDYDRRTLAEDIATGFPRLLNVELNKLQKLSASTSLNEDCKPQATRDKSAATVNGYVKQGRNYIGIDPFIIVQSLKIPLPQFHSDEDNVVDKLEQYAILLAKSAINAIHPDTYISAKRAAASLRLPRARKEQLGSELLRENNYSLAVAVLQRSSTPRSPEANYALGRAYRGLGDLSAAEAGLRQVVSMKPGWIEARAELGTVLLEREKYEEAKDQFLSVLRHTPRLPGIYRKLAQAVFLSGDLDFARAVAQRALEENSADADTLLLLCQVLIREKDFSQAYKELSNALAIHPNNEDFLQLMWEVAIRAAAGTQIEDLTTAAVAVATVKAKLQNKGVQDPDLNLLAGRINMQLYAKGRDSTGQAIAEFRAASAAPVNRGTDAPMLQVAELELAEAQFLNGQYEDAIRSAQLFLERPKPSTVDVESYTPVAHLITVASEYLLGRSGEASDVILKAKIEGFREWPRLWLINSRSTGNVTKVPLARWSFCALDTYARTKLLAPQSSVVMKLNGLVQEQVGSNSLGAEYRRCN
jgi:Flp pilus assembly protein TadD